MEGKLRMTVSLNLSPRVVAPRASKQN